MSAYSVSVALRASMALGSQLGVSSAKSIRRMWKGSCFSSHHYRLLREGEGRAFSEIGAPQSVGASSADVCAGIRRGEAILLCPRAQTRGKPRRDAVVGVGGVVNARGNLS